MAPGRSAGCSAARCHDEATMRLLSALSATALSMLVCACGGAARSGSRLRVSSAQGRASTVRHRAAPPWQSPVVHEPAYRNDGNHESPLDSDGDYLEDEDSDSRFHENS